jgi:hypothetical protein
MIFELGPSRGAIHVRAVNGDVEVDNLHHLFEEVIPGVRAIRKHHASRLFSVDTHSGDVLYREVVFKGPKYNDLTQVPSEWAATQVDSGTYIQLRRLIFPPNRVVRLPLAQTNHFSLQLGHKITDFLVEHKV